jgi:hypothetical protein
MRRTVVLFALLWASPALADVTANVHNAPGWLHSHAYSPASGPQTRVLNGSGWNEGAGTYNPGSALNAYELTSGGSCTSAASGGPSGTGSSISDGDCTWKYLSGVDYISITGWAYDVQKWAAASYLYRARVTSDAPLRSYVLLSDSCTSTIAPSGTGSGVLGDGCQWQYQADITYSSQVAYIPPQTYTGPPSGGTITAIYNMTQNYTANLWNDRPYTGGLLGELEPITGGAFHYGRDDSAGENLTTSCNPCYYTTLTAAAGESFRDTITASDPLTAPDPAKGVYIHNTHTVHGFGPDDGYVIGNAYSNLIGLQIKSDNGPAIDALNACNTTVRDSIIEGNNGSVVNTPTIILNCGPAVLANSLVVSHSFIGVWFKYPGYVMHSTIVTTDSIADSGALLSYSAGPIADPAVPIVTNTAVFGFAHAVAQRAGDGIAWVGDHNVTDNSATDSGTVVYTTSFFSNNYTISPMPGAAYAASYAGSFVNPASDWRLSSGSGLRGAGSAYGNFDVNCVTQNPVCITYNFDTPDIIGTTRPQSSAYDVGGWEFAGGAPAPVKGGKTRGGLWH